MRIGWPRSLTARILLMELVILGGAIVIVPPLTISVLRSSVARYQDDVLQTQARAVAAALHPAPGSGLRAELSPALQPIFATGYDGRAYMVVDRSGRLLFKSLYGSKALAASAPRRDQATGFHTRDFVGTSVPVRLDGMPLWVIVTQDQDQPGVIIDDVVHEFLLRYLAVLLPLLLLLPIANSLIIRQLVLVVRRVSARAANIDARNLDVRLPTSGLPTEISPLVGAANGLIERLQASFQQQKEFSGNVAHELRTPLATLQLSLDAVEDRALRDPLVRQVDRLSHVNSQPSQYDAARSEGDDGRNGRCDRPGDACNRVQHRAGRHGTSHDSGQPDIDQPGIDEPARQRHAPHAGGKLDYGGRGSRWLGLGVGRWARRAHR